MIGYLDTAAIVPLIITEPSSEASRRFWNDADAVVTSRIGFVETAAALAQARRLTRISDVAHQAGLRALQELWDQLDVLDVDDELVRLAAALSDRLGLRGYDAVHCASALQLLDGDLVAATGDRQLLDAWGAVGVATYDVNQTA